MTTLDSQLDEGMCHLDKLPHVEWDSSTPGSSRCTFPDGLSPLECQMAGHPFDGERHTIGMLRRPNGHVLKPATKAILGEREIAFYENLQTSQDPTTAQLKSFVPCYYGTTELRVFNKRTKFLTLKDITEGMAEPCVMDIKIGRRTWDPLATPEKRATEEFKYAESKRAYGFCITGFQVYCLSTGRLKKFDRDYGKKLDAKGVVEALETFLNITPEKPTCRPLITKLLSILCQIMLFFRTQRKYRFYSSSLLVAYDAQRLRHCPPDGDDDDDPDGRSESASCNRTVVSSANAPHLSPAVSVPTERTVKRSRTEVPSASPLKRSVSLSTGFVSIETIEDEKVSNQSGSCSSDTQTDRRLYRSRVPAITSTKDERDWVRVNMIDFTHVFPADDDNSLDLNYLEGIENLTNLLESFVHRKLDGLERENSHVGVML
ncbi:inositol polyphosphate multikinase [Harpegnathos saltator]|uniref:Kinase n=1 Tax=Harpegnathos saltator TaxID=610380 RepID=E2BME3_HARSA|nr:inositol polyphosphate multikinase [Harpegnathos saltator]XP_025158673.1 inositol polyphosphate multikinase [Harpegnathos saltator]XP_025158674.1 inositol polyphosphate multikinase [Harpegnathos saltator]XP_025158675.1 inositol polyphosphate multikinase [Harpegnathos saltator]XP_025158676.1 inositol polyphosphate multikinase [Harpegnathos saltator]EFN83134.1 Inositol polyphosphate multikinase [Harpegnathos saltator]